MPAFSTRTWRRRARTAGIVTACAWTVSAAGAATYVVTPERASEICFESKATLESFSGATRHVSGELAFDPASLGDSLTVRILVDLATFDTGISKRNADMRENHLETDRYPKATFQGVSVSETTAGAVPDHGTVTLTVTGTMSLHGVSRRITIPVDIERVAPESDAFRVRSEFGLRLEDYEIPRPRFLFMKVAEEQRVRVDLLAEPAQ